MAYARKNASAREQKQLLQEAVDAVDADAKEYHQAYRQAMRDAVEVGDADAQARLYIARERSKKNSSERRKLLREAVAAGDTDAKAYVDKVR